MRGRFGRVGRLAWGILGALAVASLAGCVERRYTIRTDPPGALVYVNGEELGPAPVSRSFTYYGAREITLVADGYETQRIIQPLPAPWYDNNLTDFLTENLLPFTIRDEREFVYRMAPATNPATGELLNRAEGLRSQGRQPPPPRRGGLFGTLGF
jgi:hypothetical protein